MTDLAGTWTSAVALAAGAGGLAFLRPVAALCALSAVFPFDVTVVEKAPITVYSGEAILTGLSLGLGVRWLRVREPLAGPARLALFWTALIAATAAVSALHAPDRAAVVKQILRWAQPWLLFAAVVQFARIREAPARMALWFAGPAVLLAARGIAEVAAGPLSALNAAGYVLDENPAVVRAHGPFHPNLFAPYLALALLLAAAHRRAWKVPGAVVAAGATIVAAALVLTQSRAGWVAAAVAVAAWAGSRFPARRVLAAAGAGIVLAAATAALVPAIRGRVASLAAPWNAPNLRFRVEAFRHGFALWAEHPWTGVGAGNYAAALARGPGGGNLEPGSAIRSHVHNFFLQVGLETGIVGLAAWMSALEWLGTLFWRDRAGGGGLGLAVLALFVTGNLLEVTVTHSRGVMYALGWGVAAAGLGAGVRTRVARRARRGLR